MLRLREEGSGEVMSMNGEIGLERLTDSARGKFRGVTGSADALGVRNEDRGSVFAPKRLLLLRSGWHVLRGKANGTKTAF